MLMLMENSRGRTVFVGCRDVPSVVEKDSPEHAKLRKILHTIVHDFNGDTEAFFRSIRRKPLRNKEHDRLNKEADLAREFVKSL